MFLLFSAYIIFLPSITGFFKLFSPSNIKSGSILNGFFKVYLKYVSQGCIQRNWLFATNSDFLIPIFGFQRRKPLKFQTMTFDRSKNISLKYQRFTTLASKDIGIRKSEFVAKSQFLIVRDPTFSYNLGWISSTANLFLSLQTTNWVDHSNAKEKN